jgi:hypothetical protein
VLRLFAQAAGVDASDADDGDLWGLVWWLAPVLLFAILYLIADLVRWSRQRRRAARRRRLERERRGGP